MFELRQRLAAITEREVIVRILSLLALDPELPTPAPA